MLIPPNTTLAPQAREARPIGENLNYVTLAPQARQARASGENLDYMTLASLARPIGDILIY